MERGRTKKYVVTAPRHQTNHFSRPGLLGKWLMIPSLGDHSASHYVRVHLRTHDHVLYDHTGGDQRKRGRAYQSREASFAVPLT